MHHLNLGPDLSLPLAEASGQCVAILGIRGSGKSNTAGVIFEELLAARYPLSIVDIDGEYFGLKEKYEVLVVGAGENVDIELDVDAAPGVAELSLREGVPVILDVSDMLAEERELFVLEYLTRIWSLAGKLRKPYMIGIEECHEFIPQGMRTDLKEVIARIALRGRKRGLGAVIISQRSAKVEKDVLTQAGMLFLHRVVHEVDMRVYSELLPWPKAEVKEQVTSLGVGECIYLSGQSIRKVKIRPRHTFHGGFTPSFKPVETPKLRQVRGEILAAIHKFKEEKGASLPEEELQQRLEKLEAELALKQARIRELERRLRERQAPPTANPAAPEPPPEHPVPPTFDLPPEVLRKVERLLKRLRRLPIHERRLVSFLAAREPRSYTTAELAAWADCAEATLLAEPPTELVELGLLSCERLARGITYRAQLKAFVNRAFSGFLPELGPQGCHHLVGYLRGRLCQLSALEHDFSRIA
ncbi:TPA: ATP-binding protein [Candidatus Bipolaricaulota bacterium]|nr:ATP-binding protein [Candidatus Bipolaricaulota bacterium]